MQRSRVRAGVRRGYQRGLQGEGLSDTAERPADRGSRTPVRGVVLRESSDVRFHAVCSSENERCPVAGDPAMTNCLKPGVEGAFASTPVREGSPIGPPAVGLLRLRWRFQDGSERRLAEHAVGQGALTGHRSRLACAVPR